MRRGTSVGEGRKGKGREIVFAEYVGGGGGVVGRVVTRCEERKTTTTTTTADPRKPPRHACGSSLLSIKKVVTNFHETCCFMRLLPLQVAY